ncbi:lipopolysaccharide biosynthesis protein [Devosia rhizoryzae]|uniref:Oligosaccharide flippase family protein n=1 Tax=Devosia rhizoryzae TaxID=2774137 RepID=A0ABX7C565_9HYPH|nr:oligosaccharide flippase family protein [Devosia rhizoryzae]QQR38399.1 oligosaccharide flippase family protein [Devosia rhizoryzae]
MFIRERLERVRQPAIFGLAAAVSRAGGILAVPIAAQALSLEELGYYAICVAFIQLLCQMLSLGGSVAVAKAGADDINNARSLAVRFSLVAAALAGLFFVAGVTSQHRFGLLAGLIALISALEAHQQLYQLVIRAQERESLFLATSTLKAFAWPIGLLAYVFAVQKGRADLPIELVLWFQLAVYAAVSFVFLIASGTREGGQPGVAGHFRAAVILSVPMVFHSLAQWVMSSADRIILGQMTDGETLAFYSLAYSLASIMFVIISGMALYLPHAIMKNVSRWGDPLFRLRFQRWYAVVYVVSFTVLMLAYAFDYSVTNFLRYQNPEMFLILGIVGAGFVFTGAYHFYVPFLFAAGRTGLVTTQTLKACAMYALAIVPLVHFLSAMGAAIGTMLVWVYYMMAIRVHAVAFLSEQGIGDNQFRSEFAVVFVASATCLLVSIVLWATVVS